MPRFLCVAMVCLGFLLPLSASAGLVTESEATERLISALKNLKSIHANFEQWVTDSKQNQLQHLNGEMWIQRPGQFRWDTDEPYPQKIVSNENVLWIYDLDLEQATRKKLDKQLGNTPAMLLSGDPQQITEGFTVGGYQFDETGEWRFDLRPKDEDAMFTLLRVHFLSGSLRDMYLEDSLGQTTRIQFQIKSTNQPIGIDVFELKLDESVDIIEES